MACVTVDRSPLAYREMGLRTVGQVLSHLTRDRRLVVQVLVDGREPQAAELPELRSRPIDGLNLFIETADPHELARQVLADIAEQLPEAERLKAEAADLLQRNAVPKALEQLGGCIRIWQHAHDSITKVAELLRLDLATIQVDGRPIAGVLDEFAAQLRSIKSALEQRDFVSLADALLYETDRTTDSWLASLEAVRQAVGGERSQ